MRIGVIAGLGVLLVAIIGLIGAFSLVPIGDSDPSDRERVKRGDAQRIAIATSGTLKAITKTSANADKCDPTDDTQTVAAGQQEQNLDDTQSEVEVRQQPQSELERLAKSVCVQNLLYDILTNRFEGQLSGALSASERFDVAEPSAVITAFESMLASRANSVDANAQKVAEQLGRKSPIGGLTKLLGNAFTDNSDATDQGLQEAVWLRNGNASTADFSKIADELDVDYFLFVGVGEPNFYFDAVNRAYQDNQAILLRANPFFTYRLYDVKNKRIVYAAQERLDGGLAIDLNRSAFGRAVRANFGARDALRATFADIEFKQFSAVSSAVARMVLDSVSPASLIVSDLGTGEPSLVINRGSNDGVRAGDEYIVRQVQKDVSGKPVQIFDPGTGIELSPPTNKIGRVRVTEVSLNSNLATVSGISGNVEDFSTGDLIFTEATESLAAPGSPNGSNAIISTASAKRRLGVAKPSGDEALIVVSEFDVVGLDDRATVAQLKELIVRSLTRRLTGDRRFRVVTRRDLDLIQEEYDLSIEVQGDYATGERAPVSIAGYIVSGVVEIDEDEIRRTIALRGQSRDLPSIFELRASGEVSIIDPKSVVIAAEQVRISQRVRSSDLEEAGPRGALADEFSRSAARLLRTSLYPLRVVQVQEGAGRYVINGGDDSGIEMGTILNAFSIGEPVIDFDTGVELSPGSRTLAGTLKVIDVADQISTAEADQLTGTLARGAIVEIKSVGRPSASTVAAPAKSANTNASAREEPETEVPF